MKNKTAVLIIEDDKHICTFIGTTLNANDYKVLTCHSGRDALALIPSHCPDVILLDLGLPDMDGLEVLKKLRSWSKLPVIVISARTQEREKVEALDLGADDYITKPFGTGELLARIRTALRHSAVPDQGELPARNYRAGDLNIDFDRYRIFLKDEEIHLTQIEFKLITLLAQNAGKVMTYDMIMRKIWGPYAAGDNQILRVNMANIRRKIEENPADPKYIFTEVGIGYRMLEADTPLV